MDNRVPTLIIFIFALIFFVPRTYSQTINEICPVSSGQHPYEWVEVYNNTDSPVSTTGLTITDSTNKSLQWQGQEIPPHGYVLATSSSVLNNSDGDNVIIKDPNGNIVTSQNYSGSFSADKSNARCNNGSSWATTTLVSPLSANDSACTNGVSTVEPSSPIGSQDYSNIYISEVMADPDEGGNEWVELFNNNPSEVNLIDWQIDDIKDQGASPYVFTIKIGPNSYGVVDITKNMLNNDSDSVRLLNHDSVEKNSVEYTTTQKNKTVGKTNITANGVCVQVSTKGSPNGPCIIADQGSNASTNSLQTPNTPSVISDNTDSTDQTLGVQTLSSDSSLLATQSAFQLPNLGGLIRGVVAKKESAPKSPPSPENQKVKLKTANSYAVTSFMFAWANICYILFKIRKKYLTHHEKNFS